MQVIWVLFLKMCFFFVVFFCCCWLFQLFILYYIRDNLQLNELQFIILLLCFFFFFSNSCYICRTIYKTYKPSITMRPWPWRTSALLHCYLTTAIARFRVFWTITKIAIKISTRKAPIPCFSTMEITWFILITVCSKYRYIAKWNQYLEGVTLARQKGLRAFFTSTGEEGEYTS